MCAKLTVWKRFFIVIGLVLVTWFSVGLALMVSFRYFSQIWGAFLNAIQK